MSTQARKPFTSPYEDLFPYLESIAEGVGCIAKALHKNPPGASPELATRADLAREIESLEATIKQTGARIMSAISEFAAKQATHNQKISVGLDGITTDLEALNALIVQLQNTPGPISPEDQTTLDQLEAAGAALAERVAAVDNLHPPTPPVG